MPISDTNTLAELTSFLQSLEGVNGRAELASVIGAPSAGTDPIATLVQAIQTQKATIAGRLVSAGLSAIETEALSSLAGKVPNFAGKKWASGVVNSSGTLTWYPDNTAGSVQFYPVIVSGLTFLPDIILAWRTGLYGVSPTLYRKNGLRQDTSYYMGYANIGSVFLRNTAPLSVTSSGFNLPGSQSGEYNWLAFE